MQAKLIPGETITIKQIGGKDAYIRIDENLKRSMEHNTMQLTDALRLLTVLDLPPDKIPLGTLSRAQQIVVYLQKKLFVVYLYYMAQERKLIYQHTFSDEHVMMNHRMDDYFEILLEGTPESNDDDNQDTRK